MELRQFRQFIAVAEELNFRRAAERLNMTQPPLTAAIKRIETELGVLLIERTNKIEKLTAAGRQFLHDAARTVAQAERATIAARQMGRGLRGTLRIKFQASAMSNMLPGILRRFREEFADVELDLEEMHTDRQIEALLAGTGDIGLLVLPPDLPAELKAEVLLRDRFVLALAQDHPLARHSQVPMHEAAGEKWIMFPQRRASDLVHRFHRICRNSGFTPTISSEVLGAEVMNGLVKAGLGVALVPRSVYRVDTEAVAYRELTGPGLPFSYELAVVRSAEGPLCTAFFATANAFMAKHASRSI